MAATDDDDGVLEVRSKWAVFGDFRSCLPVAVMLVISPVWLLGIPGAKFGWFWVALGVGPIGFLALYLLGHLLPMRLRVGNDGLTLKWLFGWSRFIPFREIRELRAMTRDRKSLFGFRSATSTDLVDLIELFVGKKSGSASSVRPPDGRPSEAASSAASRRRVPRTIVLSRSASPDAGAPSTSGSTRSVARS